MARRLDIELTSDKNDGTWTWRASGARQPRGVIAAALLPPGAAVGHELRVEAEFYTDGIQVTAVLPPKATKVETNRIELIVPDSAGPLVTSTLSPRAERSTRGAHRGEGRERRPGKGGGRPTTNDRGADRPSRPRRERPAGAPDASGTDAGDRAESRRARPARKARPAPPPVPARPKAKRLRPGRAHRQTFLDGLPPEHHPIAEQLLKGGVPAVRAAIAAQQEQASTVGQLPINEAPLLAIAEDLVVAARTADWLDRAEAAVLDLDELNLRDLRAVVAASVDTVRDESTKALATALRQGLDQRLKKAFDEWVQDVSAALDAGRVVRALRVAGRPADPSHRLPDEILEKLTEAAVTALAPDVVPSRWAAVLEALSFSPVRRSVTLAGPPAQINDELLKMVQTTAQRCPQVAALFGVDVKAPPGSRRRKPTAPKAGHQPAPVPDSPAIPEPSQAAMDPLPDDGAG